MPYHPQAGETDNLTEMENLTEASMLNEMKVRYNRDQIYVCDWFL